MSSIACEVLADVRDQVGESPVWSVAEQALYWVDIEGRLIRRFDWATRRLCNWTLPERVGCIALHADGGLIAAMETGIYRVLTDSAGDPTGDPTAHPTADPTPARTDLLHPVSFPHEGMRFNDGRCDREGRFWVSSMVRDMSLAAAQGSLYRLDANGLAAAQVSGLITGNGLGLSPDGRTLYLSDSHPTVQRVWAFDLGLDGSLSGRREFIDMNPHPGRPDGAAVDAEGGYWICANDAGLIHRFTPDGRLDRSLAVPVSKPSMCAFGGPGLDRLFVTSIRPASMGPEEARLAGAVFVLDPGVRGLREPAFQPRLT